MRISWLEVAERVTYELQQLEEEGADVAELRTEWKLIEGFAPDDERFRLNAEVFYRKLVETSLHPRNLANEPSSWAGIVGSCGIVPDAVPALWRSLVEDRILGGWLGRSAGCLLGKPVEKTPRAGIRELLSSNGTWPLTDYVTAFGIPQDLLLKYPWNKHSGRESLRENIECMTEDDDMNYPMLNLTACERYGRDVTSEHIIQTWLDLAPVLSTFTAERVAYVNRLNGVQPPETATVRNPYREWIGAQIRADVWGWISPAQPARAAELAWRDARVSHVRNGMYGELFAAAAIASAFTSSDPRAVITTALGFIPPASRLADAIRFVLALPMQDLRWEDTVDVLYEKFGAYHWVHTINNAALVAAAVLSSRGDFERAICNVVMGGWDTDSNGATVGSIMGTMLGAEALPVKWISPLKNRIRSSLRGFDKAGLSELARRTAQLSTYSS